MRGGPGLPIEELARRVAVYVRVERGLFEILGRWSATTPEPAVAVRFAAASQEHGWHAELWQGRMPNLRERTPSAPPAVDALLDAVGVADTTVERLVGVGRVLVPRLTTAYRSHVALLSPVSDAHVARALDLALRDELADWAAAEALLQPLLTTPEAVAVAAAHQSRLETLLAGSGGLLG